MKLAAILGAMVLAGAMLGTGSTAAAADRTTGRGTGPVIYVTTLGLYFDSIVLTDLPNNGPFQQLKPGVNGLETDYGPGTPGHLGGRWWIDVNGDGVQNDGDKFFLCPLLGPGRTTP
ncbi:MAG TPA: hypothetical protein DIC36_07915 [Gammaproteobacteria bacterium]|nr:hypothetical protein [Gammaproteobacteria bacterium]